MQKVDGALQHTKSCKTFFEYCSFAQSSITFAENHGKATQTRWHFKECYANWDTEKHTIIFEGGLMEKERLLSVQAKKNTDGNYVFSIIKQIGG